jgi:hypothetical protein
MTDGANKKNRKQDNQGGLTVRGANVKLSWQEPCVYELEEAEVG